MRRVRKPNVALVLSVALALSTTANVLTLIGPPRRLAEVYAGVGTYYARADSITPHEILTSSVSVEVVWHRRHVTIMGTETIGQRILALPAMAGKTTTTGFIALSQQGSLNTFSGPQCGAATAVDLSLAIVDENLRITERMITPLCGEVWFSALLGKDQ